jgi:parallel beta-helix repeat protein
MQKRVNLKTLVPFVLLVFLILFTTFSYKDSKENTTSINLAPSLAATLAVPAPVPAPVPVPTPTVPPCTAPNTIPATIGTSITLCGTITMTVPTIITASNTIVNCAPGTVISKSATSGAHDGIQIAPGLTNVRINRCNFNGRFSNTIKLNSGVTNSFITGNTINGAVTGIKEEFNAVSNNYVTNTITNSVIGMQLEGRLGNVVSSTISQNRNGIITGTDPSTVTSATPNSICSSGLSFGYLVCPTQNIPIFCAKPQSGQGHTIQGNTISDNKNGIITYSLDNQITANTINKNKQYGIEINAIYTGTEINTNQPSYGCMLNTQEYFQSGAQIISNGISKNGIAGIQLNGRSTYFLQSSIQYHRLTSISGNTITLNGQQNPNYGAGIVVGNQNSQYTLSSLVNLNFLNWGEYTPITNNQIDNNVNDGIFLKNTWWMVEIGRNSINSNGRNGISYGSNTQSTQVQGSYPDFAQTRYIYQNHIKNNGNFGIYVYNGILSNVFLNEINSNTKGIYVPEQPNGWSTQGVYDIICNDISFNSQEGFNYDGKLANQNQQFFGFPDIQRFQNNRVLNNGADGIRYYLNNPTSSTWFSPGFTTFKNLIQGNGFNPNPAYAISGYGANIDGFYYHGFMANNFIGNNLGNYDSGSNTIENMWDEQQFELGYDNLICKNCGGSCNVDWDCGYYSGTCVNGICQAPPGSGLTCNPSTGNVDCYANPMSLPWVYSLYMDFPGGYTPRGNFGLSPTPFVIPPSATPPLQPASCASNSQCATNSCETYPVTGANSQCGNGNFINEPVMFQEYYLPGTICPNIPGYSPPYFGILPPQHQQKQQNESLENLPIPLEDGRYHGIPKEVKESQGFREMLKDREYIEANMEPFVIDESI